MKATFRSITAFTMLPLVLASSPLPVLAQVLVTPTEKSASPPRDPAIGYGDLTNNPYILGAGDIIRIDSFDTPELVLEARYNLLADGSVTLPWVGRVSLQGLSLEEASKVLGEKFSRFIRNPVITVTTIAPRPLKIGVTGEVNRPGSYIISVISNESALAGLTQRTLQGEGGNQWPTVSRAIQSAGGITERANIRRIQVRRPQRQSNQDETINIDLWDFLQTGNLKQDILLRDGDSVIIPTATEQDAAELTQIAVSNFSPETMRVSVVGEVSAPGTLQIRPNSTLNQALLTAGGFRAGRANSRVELIRLNPNGTISRREIKVDLAQNLSDKTNPPLRNNDIVVVRRNSLTAVTETLGTILAPFAGLLGIVGTFRGFVPTGGDDGGDEN